MQCTTKVSKVMPSAPRLARSWQITNCFKQGGLAMDSDNPKLTALASKHCHLLPIWNQQRAQLYHM